MADHGKVMICRCNDVTLEDLIQALNNGIDDFELLRKYLKIGFGPCQGRGCIMIAARIYARRTGKTMAEALGNYRARPPIIPISAKYLASRGEHR